jgi:hypothetical protein
MPRPSAPCTALRCLGAFIALLRHGAALLLASCRQLSGGRRAKRRIKTLKFHTLLYLFVPNTKVPYYCIFNLSVCDGCDVPNLCRTVSLSQKPMDRKWFVTRNEVSLRLSHCRSPGEPALGYLHSRDALGGDISLMKVVIGIKAPKHLSTDVFSSHLSTYPPSTPSRPPSWVSVRRRSKQSRSLSQTFLLCLSEFFLCAVMAAGKDWHKT